MFADPKISVRLYGLVFGVLIVRSIRGPVDLLTEQAGAAFKTLAEGVKASAERARGVQSAVESMRVGERRDDLS